MSDNTTIGARVRKVRLWRGLTLQQVAALSGMSTSYLSQIETGSRSLDSRTKLRQIAEALRVAPTDLTGEPYPLDTPGLADAQRHVPALEAALMESRIGDSAADPRPLAELQDVIQGPMMTAAHSAHTPDVLAMLPDLITELQAYGRDEWALRLLVAACVEATHELRYVGQVPLAWIAAERAAEAAALVGDPVLIGAAEFGRAHARPSSARQLARAASAADALPAQLVERDPWAQEVYGMLRLTAALGAQVRGDASEARSQAEEAARVARIHGERDASGWYSGTLLPAGLRQPGVGPTWECFGPANVEIWRVALSVEAGEPARALEHAAAPEMSALPWRRRKADLLLDVARAHYQMGKAHRRQAVATLRQAEHLAAHVRASPWARDLVEAMLRQSVRDATGRELRGLAYRMGLDAP